MYMVMSQDQNGGKNSQYKDYSSLGRAEQFKCLGITLFNQNFIQKEIKCN